MPVSYGTGEEVGTAVRIRTHGLRGGHLCAGSAARSFVDRPAVYRCIGKTPLLLCKMRNDLPPLVIIGVGGHAAVVGDTALSAGRSVVAFLYSGPTSVREVLGIPVVASELALPADAEYIVAIGHTDFRRVAAGVLRRYTTLVHPRATIGSNVTIAAGTFIMAGAVVNTGTSIGRHCIINTNATIDHDCSLGDFVTIAPAATLGGRVFIGEGAVVSMGATILQGRRIEVNGLVGAHALVTIDIPSGVVAFGTPAKVMRARVPEDSIL